MESYKHDYIKFEPEEGIGYQCFYARRDVTASWENELDIYQEN